MLMEAAIYALSLPATPRPFRAQLSGAIGLWARGRRQQNRAWHPHLLRSKRAIETIMSMVPGDGTAAILGSGALFDVPLAALACHFPNVLLVDQAHLISTQRAIRRYRGVTLAWHDLSVATAPSPLQFLHDVPELKWVVSLNLLSQLAFGAPEGREREVIDAHLDALASLPCRATLITDLSYETFDRSGRCIERFDLLYGRPLPPPVEHWSWEVAPFGEDSPSTRRVHEVALHADWRIAASG